ncbi:MAG: DUF262 domain-containing protein [Salinibacterium sp.]|nr:DUF262 domain-containing protein [Salinibacterium sp.]
MPNVETTHESELVLTDEEFEDLESAERQVVPVSYSGQDFDVDGLVRRLNKNDIVIPTFGNEDETIETAGFQRGFVWTRKQMDRFIESLLLGYPIPGLFLVRQQSDEKYLVLDGQQRLRTLQAFKKGVYREKVFSLVNVADKFIGLTYETLSDPLRRKFDDAFIQATIVSTDGSAASLEAVYQIFERLNSGGTQLTPHEIRVALYAGPLIAELERLNQLENWRAIYGAKNTRLRDQELVLRVIALYMSLDTYSRPLKGFLNDFAGKYRDLADDALNDAFRLFSEAATLLSDGPGAAALRKSSGQVNAAQSEAILVGLMMRIAESPISHEAVSVAVERLGANATFDGATTRSTADEQVVEARIRIATEVFRAAS